MGKKTRRETVPRQDWGPTIHVQSIAHTGVRDFTREPIRKVPCRTNKVCAGGGLYVSSDVLAWLNKLPPSPPRNAGVKFYPVDTNQGYDPKGATYAKKIKIQASAQATLAKLGICEDLAVPVAETPEPLDRIRASWDRARDDAEPRGLEREIRQELDCSYGKALTIANEIRCSWSTPAVEPTADPVPDTIPVPARRQVREPLPRRERGKTVANYDVLRRAFCMWVVGRARLDSSGRDFYVRNRRTGKDDRAPWSAIVRTAYPRMEDFETAAREWQTRNARTIALHR
jgi:hypothetical protein